MSEGHHAALGKLFIFVQSNIDIEDCVSSGGDNANQWRSSIVFRNNISHSTLTEEVALAGHHVSKHQEYIYSDTPLPNTFDHGDQDTAFFLAGHFGKEELARIAGMKNVHAWTEYVSEIPTSSNVLRNLAGSMISNFGEGTEGLEAVSPIMDKLQEGHVVLELRQASDEQEMADAMSSTIVLFKSVCEQQGIDAVICQIPLENKEDPHADLVGRTQMTVCSVSETFNHFHIDSLDTVTCLAKHVAAFVSGSDPALIPVFTDQFAHCGEVQGDSDKRLCYALHRDSVDVYRLPLRYGEPVVQFSVPATEDLEVATKSLANQMDYAVVTEYETTRADVAGGVPIEQSFFRAMGAICGQRVGSFPAPTRAAPPAEGAAAPGAGGAVASADAGAAVEEARLLKEKLDQASRELRSKEDAADARIMEMKMLKSKVAFLENSQADAGQALNSCMEDVHALSTFSETTENERGMAQLTMEQLKASNSRVMELERTVAASRRQKRRASAPVAAAKPAAAKPAAAKPAAAKPAATKPAAAKPAAAKPAATKPAATKPAATKPAATKPPTVPPLALGAAFARMNIPQSLPRSAKIELLRKRLQSATGRRAEYA